MVSLIRKLLVLFDSWSKGELILLFAMMLMMAILEMIGVSLFIPLIQAILSPEKFRTFPVLGELLTKDGLDVSKSVVAWMALLIFAFFIIKNLALLFVVWFQNHFIFYKSAAFSVALLRTYLMMDYGFYLQRNSAELMRNVHDSTYRVLYSGFLSFLNLILESLVVLSVTSVLIVVEPIITISTVIALGSFMLLFYGLVRNRLRSWGRERQVLGVSIYKWIRQSLGAAKEIKVLGRESYFLSKFAKPSYRTAHIGTMESTINRAVSASSEVILIGGMVLILILSLLLSETGNVGDTIATLSLFAIAGFRVLPSVNKITVCLITLHNNRAVIDDIYDDILESKSRNTQVIDAKPFPKLESEIVIENVSFKYEGARTRSISNLSATIKRGQCVALVGTSGAGKSSLADLILGIFEPSEGRILADGRNIGDNIRGWQSHIGYVPQHIFLIDDTLRRNIAIGVPDSEIDEAAIGAALRLANLHTFVSGLDAGLDTMVGENGVRLSGGQRQRIGIARALYHDPDILILDEATSALDNETEYEISEALTHLHGSKTIVIIAHRLSTVKNADLLLFMANGRVTDSGTFDELSVRCDEFRALVQRGEIVAADVKPAA